METPQLLPPELLSRIFFFVVSAANQDVAPLSVVLPAGSYFDDEIIVSTLAKNLLEMKISKVSKPSLHPSLFVCKSWYFSAVPIVWNQPQFHSIAAFDRFVHYLEDYPKIANSLQRPDSAPSKTRKRSMSRTKSISDQQSHPGLTGVSYFRNFDPGVTLMLPKFITGQHLRAIADVKPNLQRLVLANCSTLEDADVMDIVMATASTLVSIDLSNCRKITSSTVEVIAFFCGPWKKLESVRLKNCSLVSDNALTLLAENIGECLKVLDLSGCRRITDAGVAMFLRKSYRRTMALRKSSLKTPNAQITVSDPNERDDFDEKVVQFQHHRVPSDRTDEKKLLVDPATQGRLTEFRISGSWIFTRGGFLSIMDYLIKMHRNLEVLEFSIPNPPKGAPIPEFVDFPVSLFGNLRSFHINRAKYLNDASLRSLIDVLNNKDARLTQLSINGRALTSHSVFNYLMTHLNNLTFLSLRNSALTDADVEHLVSSQFFPILQVLDLSGCSTLTTAALLEIGKFSQSFVLISIGNAIMELKQLVGTRNGVLTVEEFTPITFQRLHLTKLDVSKCKRISFKGVELLVKYCAYPYGCLKYLDVTECGVDIKDQVDSMLMMEIEGENLEEEHEILELHIPEYVGADTEENPRLGVVLTGKRLEAVAKRCRI